MFIFLFLVTLYSWLDSCVNNSRTESSDFFKMENAWEVTTKICMSPSYHTERSDLLPFSSQDVDNHFDKCEPTCLFLIWFYLLTQVRPLDICYVYYFLCYIDLKVLTLLYGISSPVIFSMRIFTENISPFEEQNLDWQFSSSPRLLLFLVLIISLFLVKSKLFPLKYAFFFLIPYITLCLFFMKNSAFLK